MIALQRRALVLGVTALGAILASPARAQTRTRQVTVYDGSEPRGSELESIWRSPRGVDSPRYESNSLFIPKSANGHFYVHGFLNGFPVVFMVDSGATAVALPEEMARNAGIRAGIESEVQTASGNVKAAVSKGNTVGVGPIGVDGVDVVLMKNLKMPLLGASVLEQFRITTDEKGMTLVWRGR